MIEVELSRFILVISVVIVAIEYFRTHRVTGGSLTPGYLSILILGHEWSLLISVALFTIATVLIMRLIVMRWFVLTKPWVYGTGVFVSAVLHSIVRVSTSVFTLPDLFGLVLVAGLFVTPGLIAYDLTAQGVRKTLTAIVTTVAVTCLVTLPVLLLGIIPDGPSMNPVGRIDPQWWWLAVSAAVVVTLALRMARGLATAGYIGVVFLIEVAWWESLALLLACIVVARVIAFAVFRRFILTPRQRFQLAFLIGAIVTWTAIYWGDRWGWTGATRIEAFTLEPLVIVGLIVADLSRSTITRSVVGIASACSIVVLALLSTALDPWATALCLVGLFGIVVLLAWPALAELFESVPIAVAAGRAYRDHRVLVGTDGSAASPMSFDDGTLRARWEARSFSTLVIIARIALLAGLIGLTIGFLLGH